MFSTRCLLSVACWLLLVLSLMAFVVYCWLFFDMCCVLFSARGRFFLCSLLVLLLMRSVPVRCWLSAACYVLFDICKCCCSLFVLLLVVCCLLLLVCGLWLAVCC